MKKSKLLLAIPFLALSVAGMAACTATQPVNPEPTPGPAPVEKTLASIAAVASKTEYEVGEKFDKSTLTVTATYSNGTSAVVTNYTTDAPEVISEAVKVTVSYTEGGVTKTSAINITIKEAPAERVLKEIKVNTEAHREFEVGAEFEREEILAVYDDGTELVVTDKCEFTGYIMETQGDYTVTVEYTEGEVKKETSYGISVKEAKEKSSLQTAYEAAMALQRKEDHTDKETFSGIVTGTQGNTFFLQDGEYAIQMYNNLGISSEIAVGKKVTVKSHLCNYNMTGNIESWSDKDHSETAVEFVSAEDGTPETPIKVESKEELDGQKINMLVETAPLTVKSVIAKYSEGKSGSDGKLDVYFDNESESFTLILSKYSTNASAAALFNDMIVGDTFSVDKAVVSFFDNKQVSMLDDTIISKSSKTIASVESADTYPVEVEVGSTIDPSKVILNILFSDGTKGKMAATDVVCDTSAVAEGVTATASIKDVSGTAEFKVNVISSGEEVVQTVEIKGLAGTDVGYKPNTEVQIENVGKLVFHRFNSSTGAIGGNKSVIAKSDSADTSNTNFHVFNNEALTKKLKKVEIVTSATGTAGFKDNLYLVYGSENQGDVDAIPTSGFVSGEDETKKITFDLSGVSQFAYFKICANKAFTSGTVTGVSITFTLSD